MTRSRLIANSRMRLRSQSTLILTIILAVGTCYYYFGLLIPNVRQLSLAHAMDVRYSFGGDFYPIWMTGRELLDHRSDPYTPEMTKKIQIDLYGRPMATRSGDPPAEYRAFSYPLYTDLLAGPLLPLSFNAVRLVLSVPLVLVTAASVLLWLRAFEIKLPRGTLRIFVLLTLISYPALEGLYALQAGLLVGFALAASVWALVHNRLALSGVLLAIASVKPQMMWLIAIFTLLWTCSEWKRRKALALSFVFTMALLCLVSEVMLPGWFSGWWRAVTRYSAYTLPPLPQFILGRFPGLAASLFLLFLTGIVCWRSRKSPAPSETFSLAISWVLAVTAILLPTGGAVYDQILLLPAILWLWPRREEICRRSIPLRVLALAAAVAISWQWIMACAVAVGTFVYPAWAGMHTVLVFPTRMAASLPFVVIALLAFAIFGTAGSHPRAKEGRIFSTSSM